MPFDYSRHAAEIEDGLALYGRTDNDTQIFVVDNHQTVDAMLALDFACVCVNKWSKSLQNVFAGKTVYLFAARSLRKQLESTAKVVYVGDPTALALAASKGDAVEVSNLAQAAYDEADVFRSFGFYSVPDLSEEDRRPPEFIIDGLLPCGMTFLSGAPKIRKSFFALQLAIAVAKGERFFGRESTRCDVVYFDLEGSKSRISSRAAKMSSQIPGNVYIANTIDTKLADGLVTKLRVLHRQRPSIRLLIIDTYSRARGNYRGGSANAYDQDVAFLEPIQRMALDENIAILFVHHDKKGAGFLSDSFERLSGTMGISGSADCVMNLVADGKRFEGRATLEVNPRDAVGCEMKLSFDNRFGEWQQVTDTASDLLGNPVCSWIISNIPDKRKEGVFFCYEDVARGAYKCLTDKSSDKVREQIIQNKDELYSAYGVGVQLGVQSHNRRGIRLINLM